MDFIKKIGVEWPLRIGLGTMFLWSGFDMMQHPKGWTWAIPTWFIQAVVNPLGVETYFKIQGASEILLGLVLLAWFLPKIVTKYAALLTTVEIAAILFLGKTGIDAVTFRDLGVLGAALALFVHLHDQVSTAPSGTIVIK